MNVAKLLPLEVKDELTCFCKFLDTTMKKDIALLRYEHFLEDFYDVCIIYPCQLKTLDIFLGFWLET